MTEVLKPGKVRILMGWFSIIGFIFIAASNIMMMVYFKFKKIKERKQN
jgi:hypothetical protein